MATSAIEAQPTPTNSTWSEFISETRSLGLPIGAGHIRAVNREPIAQDAYG